MCERSDHAWLGPSVAVDIALHLERPFFSVLASSERLGHITGLAADLGAPVSRCCVKVATRVHSDFRVHYVCTERSKRVQTCAISSSVPSHKFAIVDSQ